MQDLGFRAQGLKVRVRNFGFRIVLPFFPNLGQGSDDGGLQLLRRLRPGLAVATPKGSM